MKAGGDRKPGLKTGGFWPEGKSWNPRLESLFSVYGRYIFPSNLCT